MNKTLKRPAKQGVLHHSRIDIPAKSRQQLVEILNESVANTFDLYSQIKQAHWNVKGHQFYQLHLLFDQIAGEILEFVDTLAERVTTLGGTAMGTVRMSSEKSAIAEYPSDILEGLDHVAALADRFATYCQIIRENIDKCEELEDADTADLFTSISRIADQRLWFLEAHLQADEA